MCLLTLGYTLPFSVDVQSAFFFCFQRIILSFILIVFMPMFCFRKEKGS